MVYVKPIALGECLSDAMNLPDDTFKTLKYEDNILLVRNKQVGPTPHTNLH